MKVTDSSPITTHGARKGTCDKCGVDVTRQHGAISPWLDVTGGRACPVKGDHKSTVREHTCDDCKTTQSHEWWTAQELPGTFCTPCAAHRTQDGWSHIEWLMTN